MATTMTHFFTDLGDECGWHFEWAGGAAVTVRIVAECDGEDIGVFSMAEESTVDEVSEACDRWSESQGQ